MTETANTPPPTPQLIKEEKPTKPKLTMADLLKRLDELEAKVTAKDEVVQSPNNHSFTKPEAPPQNLTHQEEHDHSHDPAKPHYVGPWQQYCPTCGDKNPEFKDEVACDTCGANLGAAETATQLKACPNCGGKKAHEKEKR